MIKKLIHSTLLLIPLTVFGQLHTLSDQYLLNGLAINPAYAGSEDALSATLSYRNQWVGFKGAPKTLTAAVHSPLGNERVGLGLLILSDQMGVNSETSIIGNYAYMIEMGSGKLSLGVGLGVSFLDVNWSELKMNDLNDIEVPLSPDKVTNPNFSAGIYYNSPEWFFGLSIPMFLSYSYGTSSKEVELTNDISEYNYHIVSGYTFKFDKNLKFTPSALLKYHPNNSLQVDISSQLMINDIFGFGFTYRSKDEIATLLQLAISNQFKLAYSYDFDIGETGRYHGGSHEVLLKFVLDFNAKVVGPRRF